MTAPFFNYVLVGAYLNPDLKRLNKIRGASVCLWSGYSWPLEMGVPTWWMKKLEHLSNCPPSQGWILFLLNLLYCYSSSSITVNFDRSHILLKVCLWHKINSRVWPDNYPPVWVTKYMRVFPLSVADLVFCTNLMDTAWIEP